MKKIGKFLLRFGKGAISEIPGVNLMRTNRDSDDNEVGKTSHDRLVGQIAAVIASILALLETFGVVNFLGN